MNGVDLQLPPGFRFHPTDEELVIHYLCRKCAGQPIYVPIIADIDLYKYDAWQLPGMSVYGEKEWYFFSPRDRKYPNGSRPNRSSGSGYWKATGADKAIGVPKPIAIKKALVFYSGKAPKGLKTDWIMHEYRLADVDRSVRRKNSLRLDDWVLCRIYNKKGVTKRQMNADRKPTGLRNIQPTGPAERKPDFLSHVPSLPVSDLVHFDTSDLMPRLLAESSCSEHVRSPDFTCEKEVQSQPKWRDWESALGVGVNNVGAIGLPQFESEPDPFSTGFRDPLQDMFMYLDKPF